MDRLNRAEIAQRILRNLCGEYIVAGAGIENPSGAVLEGIAAALGVEIEALFARPAAGDEAPGPLPSGRKRQTSGR